jgi:hypothetical protein
LPAARPGTRADSTDRGATLEVFSRYFPGLSRRELGRLFDKYRKMGWIDILWDDQSGRYVVTLINNTDRPEKPTWPPSESLTGKVWR